MASHPTAAQILLERIGLHIPPERASHFDYCVRAACQDAGFIDLDSFLHTFRDSLPTHPTWQRLLHHLAIGETYFFRDAEALETRILPTLIAHRRQDASRTLRIWSVGCATGEEPYTIAMVLRHLLPDMAQWNVAVLGTDINLEALQLARRGLYSSWSVRGPIPTYADPYLRPRGNRWQIVDEIRHTVEFRYLNLMDHHLPWTHIDLIVCRNVLLYLGRDYHAPITARLRAALAEDGELLMDTLATSANTVRRAPSPPRKRAASVPAASMPAARPAPTGPLPSLAPEPIRQAKTAADQAQWDEAHRWLDKAEAANLLDLPAHYLRALVYESQGRTADAIETLRRCLYLDHNFALGYFTLGNLYAQRGEAELARQHWLNAAQLLEQQPPGDPLILADGMTVSDVLAVIREHLEDTH